MTNKKEVCNMLDASIYLQIVFMLNICLYITALSMLTAWMLAGLYLFIIGIFLLLCDADILVGFLWLIDLGVGLVLLVFVVFLTPFVQTIVRLNFSLIKLTLFPFFFFLILFFFWSFTSNVGTHLYTLLQMWFFYISWYDYYIIHNLKAATDLLILRDIYFSTTAFEFILLNFLLLYAIFLCVFITLCIRRSSLVFQFNKYTDSKIQMTCKAAYFFRAQSMIMQRNTNSGSRVWYKLRF